MDDSFDGNRLRHDCKRVRAERPVCVIGKRDYQLLEKNGNARGNWS